MTKLQPKLAWIKFFIFYLIMILGVGIDTVANNRIKSLIEKFSEKFLQRIFTEVEIARAQNIKNQQIQIAFYAKRFAAKEAFSKAVGLGIGENFSFKDIEIANDNYGKPFINLSEVKKSFLQNFFKSEKIDINLSMTDESETAQAIVIISN